MAGATNSILTLNNALDSQSGVYDLMIGNAAGMITSSNAALTVVPWVTPSIQPNTVVVGSGTYAVFTLAAGGFSTNALYQWRLNSNYLDGTWDWTSSAVASYVSPLMSEAGFYDVVASDSYASVTSSVVTLTVIPLVINAQPTNAVAWIGGNARFSMSAVGAKPLGYQWQFNGTNIPGANTNSLTMTNVQESQFGPYDVIVTNAYTNITSRVVTLSPSQVAVWGGITGESNLIAGLTNIMAIAGGGFGGCEALANSSNILVWPDSYPNPYFQSATNLVAIAGAGSDSLALRSDGLINILIGARPDSRWSNIVAISSYYYGNYAALTANGKVVVCCGTVPAGLSNVVAIAVGQSHYLALEADGTVTAWGNNNYGQTNVPPGLSNVIAIAAGASHSLALRSDGTVIGWGLAASGQTNAPAGLSNVVAIAAGGFHSLALKNDGTIVAWGLNNYGQTNVPARLTNVIAITAGEYHSMALIGDGPPVIQAPLATPTIGTNGFSISLPTQSGRVYALQFKDSLTDTNWISLPLTAGNGGVLTLTDPTATDSGRFYRVLRW